MKKTYLNWMLLGIFFLSISVNAQWTLCNKPSGSFPFSLGVYNDVIYLGTVTSGIYRSKDGGTNWTQINNGITSLQIWAINQVGGDLFASSTGGTVFKSTDGGDNWVLSNTGISATTIVRKFILYNGKIFAATTNNGILISDDNGSSWTKHNNGIVGLVAESLLIVGNDLYAGVNRNVYKYDITNQSWISKSSGLPNQTVGSLTFVTDDTEKPTLFAANINDNDISKSNNGGESWTISDNGLPNVGIHTILGVGSTIYAGNDYGVYQSNDLGANWTDISGFTMASPAKFLTKTSTDLFVLQGSDIWKKNMPNLGISDFENLNSNLIVSPNPFKDKIVLSNLTNEKIKQILVYDSLGKLVLTNSNVTDHINTSELNEGTYLIKIVLENNTVINKKMIK